MEIKKGMIVRVAANKKRVRMVIAIENEEIILQELLPFHNNYQFIEKKRFFEIYEILNNN